MGEVVQHRPIARGHLGQGIVQDDILLGLVRIVEYINLVALVSIAALLTPSSLLA